MSWIDPIQNKILSIDPDQSRQIGLKAAEEGKWGLALIRLNAAARLGKLDIQLLDCLGEAAYRQNVPEALSPYQNYFKYPSISTHMARAFMMLGDLKSAAEFLDYAKESPLKDALLAMIQLGSDIEITTRAMLPVGRKYPELSYPEYWRALAAVADAAGDESLTQFAEIRSTALSYKDPNIHFNQALRMLGKGEFRAAWRLYEWRLVPGVKNPNRTQLGRIPIWEGEKLSGKSLLIFGEQGLGDLIFGMRYITPLLHEGVKIEVVARKPVLPLIKEAYPNVLLHDEDEVAFFDYWDHRPSPDFWVYALSIPFRANLWNPINTGAFLKVPPMIRQEMRKILEIQNPQNLPIFTINWHGRIDTASDRTRAFTVEEFAKISGILEKPCFVVSLQKDATPDELGLLEALVKKSGGQFFDGGPYLKTFAQTAGFIENSERLLTCDTSVAHVGGSIGHPTTVFARNKAIWQWLRKKPEGLNQSTNLEELPLPAVWYDSVVVQYALAPKISWLFTSFTDNPKEERMTLENELQRPTKKLKELQPTNNKEVIYDNGPNLQDKSKPDRETSQLQSSGSNAHRFRWSVPFAGHNPTSQI